MVNLKESEIKKFEYIGHGGFGNIYRDGDIAYKVYSDKSFIDNPSLIYRPLKLKRLMDIDKEIKYTDLVQDSLFLDGKFAGVVIPFYDGVTLEKLIGLNYSERLNISYQLVRNYQELAGYFVYPLDFKLDNIMFVDGEVKFIDLDDCLTKVCFIPHLISKRRSITQLSGVIKGLLSDYNYAISLKLKEIVGRSFYLDNMSFEALDSFLDEKSTSYDYIFISDNSDLTSVKLFRDSKHKIIYTSNRLCFEDEIYNKVLKFKDEGVLIYDIISQLRIDEYLDNVLCDNAIEIVGKEIVKKK